MSEKSMIFNKGPKVPMDDHHKIVEDNQRNEGGVPVETLPVKKSFESLGLKDPEDLTYTEQEEMALELAASGETDFLLDNLSRMRQLSNEVAIAIVKAKPGSEVEVIDNKLSFKQLDYNQIVAFLAEKDEAFSHIKSVISRSHGIEFGLVEKFLNTAEAQEFIAFNLERFVNVDRKKLIDVLIESKVFGFMLNFFQEMTDEQMNTWLGDFSKERSPETARQVCENINRIPRKFHPRIANLLLGLVKGDLSNQENFGWTFFEYLDDFSLEIKEVFDLRFKTLGLDVPMNMNKEEMEYFAKETSPRIFLANLAAMEDSVEKGNHLVALANEYTPLNHDFDEEFTYTETLITNDFPGWYDRLVDMKICYSEKSKCHHIPGVIRLMAISEAFDKGGFRGLMMLARRLLKKDPFKKALLEINFLKMGLAGKEGSRSREDFLREGLIYGALEEMTPRECSPENLVEIVDQLSQLPEFELRSDSGQESADSLESSFTRRVETLFKTEKVVDDAGVTVSLRIALKENPPAFYLDGKRVGVSSFEEAKSDLEKLNVYAPEVDGFIPVSILFEFDGKKRASREFLDAAMKARKEVRLDQQFNLRSELSDLKRHEKNFLFKGEKCSVEDTLIQNERGMFQEMHLITSDGQRIDLNSLDENATNEFFSQIVVEDEVLGKLELKDYLRITKNNYRGVALGNLERSTSQIMARANELREYSSAKDADFLELRRELIGQFRKLGQITDQAIERIRKVEDVRFVDLREQILTEQTLQELSPEQVQRIEQGLYHFFQKKEVIKAEKREIERDPKGFLERQRRVTLVDSTIEVDFSLPGVISFGIRNKEDYAALKGFDAHEANLSRGVALIGAGVFEGVINLENLANDNDSDRETLEHEWRHQMHRLLMAEQGARIDQTIEVKDELLAFLSEGVLVPIEEMKSKFIGDHADYPYRSDDRFYEMQRRLLFDFSIAVADPAYFHRQEEIYRKEKERFKKKVSRMIEIAYQVRDREGNIDVNLLTETPISLWKDLRRL